MLEAPAGAAPRQDETFVVLDEQLTLRALSMNAERDLLIREPDAVGQPIESLLPLSAQTQLLEISVKRAVAGDLTVRHAAIWLGSAREKQLKTRIACCGPPPAALVVFEARRADLRATG